jgi:hypothetical protein
VGRTGEAQVEIPKTEVQPMEQCGPKIDIENNCFIAKYKIAGV